MKTLRFETEQRQTNNGMVKVTWPWWYLWHASLWIAGDAFPVEPRVSLILQEQGPCTA